MENKQQAKTSLWARKWIRGLPLLMVLCLPLMNLLWQHRFFFPAPGLPDANGATSAIELVAPQYHLTKSFVASLVPYALVAAALILFYWRLAGRLRYWSAAMRSRSPEVSDAQSGSSAVEFLLIFPLLLTVLLTTLQIALIVQAKFVVNYAAFAAARSAIVTIPARIHSGTGSEERNRIVITNKNSPKMKIIRRAAAFPCLAISPRWSVGLSLSTGSAYNPMVILPLQKLWLFALTLGDDGPSGGMVTQTTERAMYAYDPQNTSVTVLSDGSEGNRVTDHAAITVKVTHRYYLTVPFASYLLGQGFRGGLLGIFSSARYYPIVEEFTLLNEGEPLYPESQKNRFRDADVEQEKY